MFRYTEVMAMLRRKKREETVRNLIKNAYILGYEVGYYRHQESVGWVKKRLRRFEEEAERAGILDEVMRVYKRGKIDGARKRVIEIGEGRDRTIEMPSIDFRVERTRIRTFRRVERRPVFTSLPKFLKRRYQF